MNSIPILVVSCDAYSDLWNPFFATFRAMWPDCHQPTFLGTNYLKYDDDQITSIQVGDDKNWALNLHKMLAAINSDRVIIFLEDFLIVDVVNDNKVQKLVEVSVDNDLDCLRLKPDPPPNRRLKGFENLGVIDRGEDYRVSTQVAIWKADTLKRLAVPGFSAWDFEIYGTYLADRNHTKFWGVYDPVINTINGVERGKWLQPGLDLCDQLQIVVDRERREVQTNKGATVSLFRKYSSLLSLVALVCPKFLRRFIRLRRTRVIPFFGDQSNENF